MGQFGKPLGLALAATLLLAAAGVRTGIEAWQKGDHAAAVAAWRPLAASGDADAAFNLGQAYRLGKGVPLDLAQAQILFEQAARKNHVDAATTLGVLLFQNGNRAASMRWLRQAADAGEPRAMLIYGSALYNGDGIAPDRTAAYAYVSRSAAQGFEPARAALADLDAAMALDQRREGVAQAQEMVGVEQAESSAPTRMATVAKPKAVASKTPTAAKVAKAAPVAPAGKWRIQLGAFGQRRGAETLFARLRGKLAGRQAYYVPAGKMVRLQVGPFASRAEASAACARLAGQACFPVAPR